MFETRLPNHLLQSAGAIISKRWVVVIKTSIDQAGLTYDVDYTRCAYVHDEVQPSVVPSEVDRDEAARRQASCW